MAQNVRLEKLLEPITIRGMKLRNRIVMAPMGTQYSDERGMMTERGLKFYEERAKGGVGLIIFESTVVDTSTRSRHESASLATDASIPSFQQLTEIVHKHGARIAVQLSHLGSFSAPMGSHSLRASTTGKAGATAWVSGSAAQDEVRKIPTEEIPGIIQKFADAAVRAKKAGFDAVELHGGHGLLLHEFLSPMLNTRDDGWGGDLEGRVRFPVEVSKAVRKAIGNMVLIYRISASEGYKDKGLGIEESKIACQRLEKAGVDIMHVSSGTAVVEPMPDYPPFPPMRFPRGIFVEYAAAIKKVVNVPVITVGRLADPRMGEEILKQGKADLIGFARPMVTDPEMPNKVAKGELDDIRQCIACMTCVQSLFTRKPMACLVNPAVGREKEFTLLKAAVPKKFVIVGGGPAGMEAARVAALRGHRVVLFEKESRLGGQLNLACLPPHKEEIKTFTDWLIRQITRLNVDVRLGQEATVPLVDKEKPEVLLVATGALPLIPTDVVGVNQPHVVTAWDVLQGQGPKLGKRVLVIGGLKVGCETAEFLAEKGHEVVVCGRRRTIAEDSEQNERRYLLKSLNDKGVKLFANTPVFEIKIGEAVVGTWGKTWTEKCDNVVLATGATPNRGFFRAAKEKFPGFLFVGDCLQPRTAREAVYEGAYVAREM
ncbi:MAG: FAD-dependent oxidoreductase [Chloroflexi bacterium]|nr:FAD-dependent oxidoreductase [Chloroflexota bacterium]